jgi:hypothetical protein
LFLSQQKALVAGHTELAAGSDATVLGLAQTVDGEALSYRVAARRTYPKAALPGEVFRGDGPGVLRMVTCGGPYDASRHHYRDNVVVTALTVAGG